MFKPVHSPHASKSPRDSQLSFFWQWVPIYRFTNKRERKRIQKMIDFSSKKSYTSENLNSFYVNVFLTPAWFVQIKNDQAEKFPNFITFAKNALIHILKIFFTDRLPIRPTPFVSMGPPWPIDSDSDSDLDIPQALKHGVPLYSAHKSHSQKTSGSSRGGLKSGWKQYKQI